MFRTWISYLNTNLDQRLIPRFTIIQLVLSAGINTAPYSLDADGIDRHSGVNWLGHFYVVNILSLHDPRGQVWISRESDQTQQR